MVGLLHEYTYLLLIHVYTYALGPQVGLLHEYTYAPGPQVGLLHEYTYLLLIHVYTLGPQVGLLHECGGRVHVQRAAVDQGGLPQRQVRP